MVDARGYSCPTPVIMVQKAVKDGAPATLEVAVDNQCSVENVTRFARNAGYQVQVSDLDGDFKLTRGREAGDQLRAYGLGEPPGTGRVQPVRTRPLREAGKRVRVAYRVAFVQGIGPQPDIFAALHAVQLHRDLFQVDSEQLLRGGRRPGLGLG